MNTENGEFRDIADLVVSDTAMAALLTQAADGTKSARAAPIVNPARVPLIGAIAGAERCFGGALGHDRLGGATCELKAREGDTSARKIKGG